MNWLNSTFQPKKSRVQRFHSKMDREPASYYGKCKNVPLSLAPQNWEINSTIQARSSINKSKWRFQPIGSKIHVTKINHRQWKMGPRFWSFEKRACQKHEIYENGILLQLIQLQGPSTLPSGLFSSWDISASGSYNSTNTAQDAGCALLRSL